MQRDTWAGAKEDRRPDVWILYWLACEHQKTYVGITMDLERRFKTHQAGRGGRFTRAFRPTRILGVQPFPDRASATRAECWLKAQVVAGKRAWAQQWPFVPSGTMGWDCIETEEAAFRLETADR